MAVAIKKTVPETPRTEKESGFWRNFGKIYRYLEYSSSYKEMANAVVGLCHPRTGEIRMDAGCGSLGVTKLLLEKLKEPLKKMVGIDIFLDPARERLKEINSSTPIELVYANLGERLPFPPNFFDGIVANACLTFVVDFYGETGKDAFEGVMGEMFRVLKPGGELVWSTPKRKPFYWKNFLLSIPTIFSPKQARLGVFAPVIGIKIFKYGLGIVSKGRKGIYTFLDPEEYEEILKRVGFEDFTWKKTFAGQVWVNRACKPRQVV